MLLATRLDCVAQLARRPASTRAHRLRRDAVAAVDGLRHRRDRDARGRGHVVDRRPSSHGPIAIARSKAFSKTFDTRDRGATLQHSVAESTLRHRPASSTAVEARLNEENRWNHMKAKTLLAATAALAAGRSPSAAAARRRRRDAGGDVTMTFWHNSTTGRRQAATGRTRSPRSRRPTPASRSRSSRSRTRRWTASCRPPSTPATRPTSSWRAAAASSPTSSTAGQVKDITDGITDATQGRPRRRARRIRDRRQDLRHCPTPCCRRASSTARTCSTRPAITETPDHDRRARRRRTTKLKASGRRSRSPLGAKDAWPAAHWYYNFALRACSQDVVNEAAASRSFDDPCWEKAGDDLADFAETEPVQRGLPHHRRPAGRRISAGLLANHQAAMELMGAWDPGVIASLTPDEQAARRPRLVPVPGGSGRRGRRRRDDGRRRRVLLLRGCARRPASTS